MSLGLTYILSFNDIWNSPILFYLHALNLVFLIVKKRLCQIEAFYLHSCRCDGSENLSVKLTGFPKNNFTQNARKSNVKYIMTPMNEFCMPQSDWHLNTMKPLREKEV